MSASSTWWYPLAPSFLSVSRAAVALRRGRNPYEHGKKSASKIGSSTSFAAIWTTRSRTVGMPNGRFLPSAFGMYRRSTTPGRYLCVRSTAPSSSKKRSTPYCSTPAIVSASTPAAPLLALTRFHASFRTSPRKRWWYSAWKRLAGFRLAADHSRRCSCRTFSRGLRPPGSLGPLSAAIPSRLPAPTTPPPQGPFPPATLFAVAISGTTIPSDSRCARPDFAFGLYGRACRDDGCADGPLVFRALPCTRAAPPPPPGPPAGSGPPAV